LSPEPEGSLTLDNMVFVATNHISPQTQRSYVMVDSTKIELGTCDKDMLQSMFKKSSIASFRCVLDRFIEDKHIPATLMTTF
jgi:hypothetical protein